VSDPDEAGFAWRVVKTTFVLMVVALAAALLHFLIEALREGGLPPPIVGALTFVEYLILFADILWFLRFLMVECSRHLGAIWRSGPGFRAALMLLLLILVLIIAVSAIMGVRGG
jgi:hypothetical protein